MPHIITDVEFEIYCGTCGWSLNLYTKIDNNRKTIYVEACPRCMMEKEKRVEELESKIEEIRDFL